MKMKSDDAKLQTILGLTTTVDESSPILNNSQLNKDTSYEHFN